MFRRFLLSTVFLLCASPTFAATVSIIVDLSSQEMTVNVGGVPAYVWDVSSGKPGYRTPTGRYEPQRMYAEYYSRTYDDSPMPYSIFFSAGYAIHGTNHVRALGSPASHGCVRLSVNHARTLYELVREYGREDTSIRIVR